MRWSALAQILPRVRTDNGRRRSACLSNSRLTSRWLPIFTSTTAHCAESSGIRR
ncbi:hypothetical protein KCP73_20115 [Salmonella enterica subsp. enterica]|nr:hypothetical protein KCP73_20115 [Salmonella enterica subsp. enterica]